MAKKKDDDLNERFMQMMSELNMSEADVDMAKQMLNEMLNGDSNDPNSLNMKYYDFGKTPDRYNTGSNRKPKWLKRMWNADCNDWLELCHETEAAAESLTDEQKSRDIRKYIYMLIDDFNDNSEMEQDGIRLIGPLWLIERFHLSDCLDLVHELLRQEAWFYTAFIDPSPQCISAVLYQIGNDRPELIRDMLYEDGLIPVIKPILFNALIWICLLQPQRRLSILAKMTSYLKHCLKICKQGASAHNISNYAYALAYAHIDEMRPMLKRLYTELDQLDMEEFQEVEEIYDDPDATLVGSVFESVDGYLNYHEAPDDDEEDLWDDEWDDEWDKTEEYEPESGLCDRRKPQKRYSVRIELADAPDLVERTLQIPSNIRLNMLPRLIHLAFGRKDEPTDYSFQSRDELYPDYACDGFTLGDLLTRKGQTAFFSVFRKDTGIIWKHGLVLEKSGEYSERTTNLITLLDGRGTYPSKSVASMDDYAQRFLDGRLPKPNFKTIRQNIREFEEQESKMK